MDTTLERQANAAVDDLALHGGGTYERGTLLPFTPSSGFAVGIGGIHLPVDVVGPQNLAWAAKCAASEYETAYVGTWLDEGIVYFDGVLYFSHLDGARAIACARFYGQKAIYDFATKEAVNVD